MKIKYFIPIIALLVVVTSCKNDKEATNETEAQRFTGNAIGTTYSIIAFDENEIQLQREVDSIIDMFNQSMSTWVPNSLINRFNQGEDSVLVGKPFKEVFDQADKVYADTKGYFDPTVGNLVNAYGFGADGSKEQIPDESYLDSLKRFVGFKKLRLLSSEKKDSFYLTSDTKGVYLEFNAIGKGTLVDHLAGLLRDKNIDNFLVEVGGEVVASGQNVEKDQAWAIGIDDPKQKPGERTYLTVVNLKDRAMAGSGNYRKNKVDPESGITYVHTVNPITGEARPSQVLGVNVMAKNCTLADGYATAFMAMPLEISKDLIHTIPEIDVLLMYMDNNGLLRFEMTDGFKKSLKQQV